MLGLVARDHDPHVDHALKYLRCGGANRLPRPSAARRGRHDRGRLLHRGERRSLPRGGVRGGNRRARRLRAHPPLHPVARHLAASVLGRAGARRPRRLLRLRRRHPAEARDRDGLRRRARGPDRGRARRARVRLRDRLGPLRARPGGGLGGVRRLGRDRRPRSGLEALLRHPRRGGADRPLRHPRPPGPGEGLGPRAPAAGARSPLLLRARRRGDRRGRRGRRGLDRRLAQAGRRAVPGGRVRRDVRGRRRGVRALLGRPRARGRRLRLRSRGGGDARLGCGGALPSSSGRERRLEPLG